MVLLRQRFQAKKNIETTLDYEVFPLGVMLSDLRRR